MPELGAYGRLIVREGAEESTAPHTKQTRQRSKNVLLLVPLFSLSGPCTLSCFILIYSPETPVSQPRLLPFLAMKCSHHSRKNWSSSVLFFFSASQTPQTPGASSPHNACTIRGRRVIHCPPGGVAVVPALLLSFPSSSHFSLIIRPPPRTPVAAGRAVAMPPKNAAKKMASAPTADITITLEGVLGSAETSTLPGKTSLKKVRAALRRSEWDTHLSIQPTAFPPTPPHLPHLPGPDCLDAAPRPRPWPLAPHRQT